MEHYRDLYELFEHDRRAKQYFNNLPDWIREQVTRAGGIGSYDSLRQYADNLLRWQQ